MQTKPFCLLLALLPCVLAPVSAHAWQTGVLDSTGQGGDGGEYADIAVDSAGAAHVGSWNSTLNALEYSTDASGAWVTTIVDTNSGRYPSIAVDASDKVHLSYASGQGLRYATNASGSWVRGTVDPGELLLQNDLAVDTLGNVHLCYFDGQHDDLKYATNDGGSWAAETIEAGAGAPFSMWAAVATDGAGHAHVSYYQAGSQDLKYATNASGAWVRTTLASADNVGEFNGIAVDSAGAVHISCHDRTASSLLYLTNASGSWVSVNLGTGGLPTAIAVGPLDRVHIGYFDYHGYQIRYATNAAGSWLTTPAMSDSGGGDRYLSLAVDGSGHAHLACASSSAPDLFYLTNRPGYWRKTPIQSRDELGLFASIAVDSGDHPHLGYMGTGPGSDYRAGLKLASNASGTWAEEVVAPYVARSLSLAVDGNDNPHIGYSSPTSLVYASRAGGAWERLTLESYFSLDYGIFDHVSLVVDGSERAHISYVFSHVIDFSEWIVEYTLRYATNASGAWVITDLAGLATADAGDVTAALAVDAGGKVHLSYVEGAGSHPLKYLTNLSGTWETVIVDTGLPAGNCTSIAVDSAGGVHISYVKGGLSYAASLPGGGWDTAVLDGGADRGLFNSIAVDAAAATHIGYSAGETLRYATNASGAWVVETACERPFGCGEYASLALESGGTVVIGHHGDDGTLLLTSSGALPCEDGDGDGYGVPAVPECTWPEPDCDDAAPAVHPGALEGPAGSQNCGDGLDNDCDGLVDGLDPACAGSCFDEDGDGYGNPGSPECAQAGWDCNDGNPAVNPGAPEVCEDGVDNDCDGVLDEGCGGYSAAANAEAAGYGRSSFTGSGVANQAGLLLLPAFVLMLLKVRRVRK